MVRKCLARWILAVVGSFPLAEGLASVDYERSSIEIVGKAVGFFPAVFHFDPFEAEVEFASGSGELKKAVFHFDYNRMTADSPMKDRRVRDWLEAERFPKGMFTLERITTVEGKLVAIGPLTLHGETHEARFTYTVTQLEETITLEASALIDYRDWNLPVLRILFFKINENLAIHLKVVAAQ